MPAIIGTPMSLLVPRDWAPPSWDPPAAAPVESFTDKLAQARRVLEQAVAIQQAKQPKAQPGDRLAQLADTVASKYDQQQREREAQAVKTRAWERQNVPPLALQASYGPAGMPVDLGWK